MAKLMSAGVIPIRRTADGWRILVLRCYKNWDFPKGHIEAGEEPIDTARRETEEETGLTNLKFPYGEMYRDTLPYAGGKIARYYIAETDDENVRLPINEALGRPEHHEWRWVTLQDAEDLLPPRLALILDWARQTLED